MNAFLEKGKKRKNSELKSGRKLKENCFFRKDGEDRGKGLEKQDGTL